MCKFVEILLPLALDNTFTYSIPDSYKNNNIRIGSRLVVSFGKRRLYTGLVTDIYNEKKSDYEIKDIIEVYDEEPIVNDNQLKFWRWIADYYCCTLGEVFNAAVSSIFIPNSQTLVHFEYKEDIQENIKLSKKENEIIEILKENKKLSISQLAKITNTVSPVKHLNSLNNKGLIDYEEKLKSGYKPQTKNYIEFNLNNYENSDAASNIPKNATKQINVIDYLTAQCKASEQNCINIEEKVLLKHAKASKSTINALVEKQVISIQKKQISRFADVYETDTRVVEFSSEQKETYSRILKYFKTFKPVLLHGVTSSGKTEIYIKLLEKTLKSNKTALYLLPEIALTSQTIRRLKMHFGDEVGIYHSKYSKSERAELYKNLLKGKIKIVLGARSAIFLPFIKLGLIIVDEEHDSSYKQIDPAPRYNARDAAIVLSNFHKANIILGSATPAVESYNNTIIGKYNLAELKKRHLDIKLPEIVCLDIKDAYRRKIMRGHFHPYLNDSIKESLENKEQVILFQNRRGYSPYIQCSNCAHIPICTSCNVSLTYHKYKRKLICHYCGLHTDVLSLCPECKTPKLITKGMGTEQIEDEVAVHFPEAVIKRLDYDTARTRKSYERIINEFADGKINILIGTQMVSKGLDFDNVSLVGVMNADNMLSFPNFRACERSFQMLTQVSGRAGRKNKQGKVIIQSFDPEHQIIKDVINYDYDNMFQMQMHERKLFNYPPFSFIITIRFKHKSITTLNKAVYLFAEDLKRLLYDRVKGPEEPVINKIKNEFIKNVHIMFEKNISAKKIKKELVKKCKALKSISDFSSIKYTIDVDPS